MVEDLGFTGQFYKGRYDSPEEFWFECWCVEAVEVGVLESYEIHRDIYELTPKKNLIKTETKIYKNGTIKKKEEEFNLFHNHSFKGDYKIVFSSKYPFLGDLKGVITHTKPILWCDNKTAYIDVKGGFNLHNNHREFSINQKHMYDKFGLYFNKVDISTKKNSFFDKMWCPKQFIIDQQYKRKTGSKIKYGYRDRERWLRDTGAGEKG